MTGPTDKQRQVRAFISSTDVLVIFAEAQARVVQFIPPADGFVFPQQGKSGLSRPVLTPEERRAKRSEISCAGEKRRRRDPAYRAAAQAKSTARVKAWREKRRAAVRP